MNKYKRNSNFEILRIISIIMVIVSHYCAHGFESVNLSQSYTMKALFVRSLRIGEIGVGCFVLISGYYMLESNFKISKVIKLEAEVIFYGLLDTLINIIYSGTSVDIKQLVKVLFPNLFNQYWFVSAYLIIYILSPFLNILIKHVSKEAFRILLIIILTIWVIIPTFLGKVIGGGTNVYSIVSFCVFYFIAVYIRIYNIKFFEHINLGICFTASFMVMCISVVVFSKMSFENIYRFYDCDSLFVLICSMALFIYFKNRKVFFSKAVNWCAGSVFGIYLLHDNAVIYDFLWNGLLRVRDQFNSKYFLVCMSGSILAIFIAGVMVDKLRIYFVERPIIRVMDSKLCRLDELFEQLFRGT